MFGKYEWDKHPVTVERAGKREVLPVNEVRKGDKVWIGTVEHTVFDTIPDDDEQIFYIMIDPVNSWPAPYFM